MADRHPKHEEAARVGVLAPETDAGGGSLQTVAREAIKARILQGDLAAGAPLSEEALARELSMSRTPIRHALLDLASQSLVERVAGRGFSVSRIDVRKALEIIEVQECLLEWCVPRLCASQEIDLSAAITAYEAQVAGTESGNNIQVLVESRRMDVILIALSGNQQMERYMREISDLLLHAASHVARSREKLAEAVAEHGAIIAELERRDAGSALAAVRAHSAGVRRRLVGFPA